MLSDDDIRKIHDVALRLVESVGMHIRHPRSLDLLAKAGCSQADGVVKIPARLVEELRQKVPSSIPIYDRDGQPAMTLGGYNSYFGSGSDLMSTWDLETQELRPSSLEDTRRAARLCRRAPQHLLRHVRRVAQRARALASPSSRTSARWCRTRASPSS